MADALSNIWGLKAPKTGSQSDQAKDFRKDCCDKVREVAACIDSARRYAQTSYCDALYRELEVTLDAYQRVAKKIDPEDPDKARGAIKNLLANLDRQAEAARKLDKTNEQEFKEWSKYVKIHAQEIERIDALDAGGYDEVKPLLDTLAVIQVRLDDHEWLRAKGQVEALKKEVEAAETAHAQVEAAKATVDAAIATAAALGFDLGVADKIGSEEDDDEIIILEEEAAIELLDAETEAEFKRKFEQEFPKLDKLAVAIIEVPHLDINMKNTLGERQDAIKSSHAEIIKYSAAGAYSTAYELLVDFLKIQIEAFKVIYKPWREAMLACEALVPSVKEKLAKVADIDAFNRELQTELEHVAELRHLDDRMKPYIDDLDYIKALEIAQDMDERLDHLLARDAALEEQRQVVRGLQAIADRMHAVLQHPGLPVLAGEQGAVKTRHGKLETATLGEDFPKALQELDKIEDEILTFELAKDQFDEEVAAIEAKLKAADPAALDVVAREIIGLLDKPSLSSLPAPLRERLTKAVEAGAENEDKAAATASLEETEPVPVAEDDDGMGGRLDQAEKHFQDFKKYPKKKQDLIKRQSGEIGKLLAQARKAVDAGDSAAAEAHLARIEELFEEARAALELLNGYPDPDALQAVLDNNGGAAAFDKIVKSLPDGLPQRAFESAIEARFGMELELMDAEDDPEQLFDKSDRGLKQIYEMLEMVPEHHVIDNAMLEKIVRHSEDDDGGLWHDDGLDDDGNGTGHIEILCGRPDPTVLKEDFIDPSEEEIDADCQREEGAKAPTVFSFTTLHEIGHAVDEKHNVMASRMTKVSFGGWVDHKGDVETIAEIAAKHFGYDKRHIQAMLKGGDLAFDDYPASPDDDDETVVADWQKKLEAARDWCHALLVSGDNGLFDSGSESRKRAINGRVYHQAYEDQWVSYDLAARRQAFSSYQFRAPGEWFAELYAAYYSGQLKESHPAVAWLKELETPEGTAAMAAE